MHIYIFINTIFNLYTILHILKKKNNNTNAISMIIIVIILFRRRRKIKNLLRI